MKSYVFAALLLVATVARSANIDYIDAAGVTETGGVACAHMLTRTGSDGRLAASLLPPVADWASQPIPRLYYVSGGAVTQGNGSPQYPFNTLTYALSHVTPGSAVLFAPYTYTGSFTLASGAKVTLLGCGSAVFNDISVAVSGSSADTELCLCNARVGTLNVTGGKVNIRLIGTTITSLTGSASPATVTRTDMGSYVAANALGATDVYAGFDTAQKAQSLVNGSDSMTLSRVSGKVRAVVGTDTVAYLSDVKDATNAVYVTISGLRAEDTRIEGLVGTEREERIAYDIVLSNRIDATESTLDAKIDEVGSGWDSKLVAINSKVTTMGASIDGIKVTETNNVHILEGKIDAVRTDFGTADTTLKGELQGDIASSASSVRADVPSLAKSKIESMITAAKPGIIEAAVDEADENSITRINNNNAKKITPLETAVDSMQDDIEDHTTAIGDLEEADTTLDAKIDTTKGTLEGSISTLGRRVSTVEGNHASLVDTVDGIIEDTLPDHRGRINAIINALNQIKGGTKLSDITVPDPLP